MVTGISSGMMGHLEAGLQNINLFYYVGNLTQILLSPVFFSLQNLKLLLLKSFCQGYGRDSIENSKYNWL